MRFLFCGPLFCGPTLFDGSGWERRAKQDLLVEDGTIAGVGAGLSVRSRTWVGHAG